MTRGPLRTSLAFLMHDIRAPSLPVPLQSPGTSAHTSVRLLVGCLLSD